jgi:transcriptional antiterminator NusG
MINPHSWYVVNVYSGFEKKVAQAINEQAEKKGILEKISEILVPVESVVEVKKGAKVNVERKFFPGYILVKMELTDETWHLIKNIPKVSGFLGAKGKAVPIKESEALLIQNQMVEGTQKQKSLLMFDVGETVRISSGPFATFAGIVEDIDEEKSRLKVSVTIFGRATPVEVEYSQVEKSS